MTNLKFRVHPRYNDTNTFSERLSDCLWKLDHNNPANFTDRPHWARELDWFVYNINYCWRNRNQVIFSVGYLGEEYIKHYNIDPATQPYWCGIVKFDTESGKLFIDEIEEWEYINGIEGSKKTGWMCRANLKDIFMVEVKL